MLMGAHQSREHDAVVPPNLAGGREPSAKVLGLSHLDDEGTLDNDRAVWNLRDVEPPSQDGSTPDQKRWIHSAHYSMGISWNAWSMLTPRMRWMARATK